MATTKKFLQAAAGAAGGAAEFTAIEDVFSTYLYTGTGSSVTVTNGVDLANEGGMVWIKGRSVAYNHNITDTERGVGRILNSNTTLAETYAGDTVYGVSSFNSDGFATGTVGQVTESGNTFASWTFRKAPRFFDVVTYTGDGTTNHSHVINHNLGTDIGFIVIKGLSNTFDWQCTHADLATGQTIKLNKTDAASGGDAVRIIDENSFSVAYNAANQSGLGFVAYLFAHDPLGPSGDGSDGLIACGSYTGNGSTDGPEIDLGWEPQWVMVKNASAAGNWTIQDNMRGFIAERTSGSGLVNQLFPNLSDVEDVNSSFALLQNGFQPTSSLGVVNASGETYIYIAIRRGPMRVPTSGTEVFAADIASSSGTYTNDAGFPVDLAIITAKSTAQYNYTYDRLRGTPALYTSENLAEQTSGGKFDSNTLFQQTTASGDYSDWIGWMFRRAPNFFDIVIAPWADGTSNPHNLGVTPELIIKKTRNAQNNWFVWSTGFANDDYLLLNGNAPKSNGLGDLWVSIDDAQFTTANYSITDPAVYYLFASASGVSKIGTFTGNGTSQTIDCGFTSGARFVVLKRTDSSGRWYIFDTTRGIVSGNDPWLQFNDTAAQNDSFDVIDPDSSGFIVNDTALETNVSGATYLYLAIA